MKIILLTTLPNRVASALATLLGENLYLFDVTRIVDRKTLILKTIHQEAPDMLITYRCPYILTDEILATMPLGAYNIHPSLLPKYKGANPWTEIFRNHETVSGVTLHRITAEIDSGKIISQQSFAITADDTILSAREKADEIAGAMVSDFVRRLSSAFAELGTKD